MDAAALPKITLPEATYSIQKGRDRVVINDAASVPADYCHPPKPPLPDMKKIGDAVKAGEQFNWAVVEQGEPSLSVRTK
jgi:hypothetical protein